jgi:hypothetical protein
MHHHKHVEQGGVFGVVVLVYYDESESELEAW